MANSHPKTLKRFVLSVQSISAITVVLSYSLVVSYYFILGLDEANFQDLHLESDAFASAYNANITKQSDNNGQNEKKNDIPLPNNIHYQGVLSWQEVPEIFKSNFEKLQNVKQMTMESTRTTKGFSTLFYPEKALFIVAQPLLDNKTLYLTREIDIKKYDELSKNGILKMFIITLPIALVFLIIMHVLVKLVLKRTLKLVDELGSWVDSLTIENVKDAKPNFEFIELNRIATLQQTSLLRMSEMLDKEQSFLCHASHELRTPIAVVKSNSELLSRVLARLKEDKQGANVKALAAISRIHRAALNMQHSTETLLWLSREESSELSKSDLVLATLLNELIEENKYLLQSKKVELVLALDESVINIPVTPCRLVLNNIIRNAFQYTAEGQVNVSCKQGKVTIINSNVTTDEFDHSGSGASLDYGYGLGLNLVEKIVDKMKWQYKNQAVKNGHNVIIEFI